MQDFISPRKSFSDRMPFRYISVVNVILTMKSFVWNLAELNRAAADCGEKALGA